MQNDLLIDINNIQYYLGKTDFIIGSGGIGLLERVKIGIPSITILSARNQLNQTKILEEKRTSLFFNKDKIYTKKFKYSFLEYIHNHSLRSDMYKNCKKLLNNNGSVKLLKKIQDHNYKKNG